ncbi:MAG: Na+/H+-dicarboxylate symporters, partial [uncultured Sphingomonadaceae bacterium]
QRPDPAVDRVHHRVRVRAASAAGGSARAADGLLQRDRGRHAGDHRLGPVAGADRRVRARVRGRRAGGRRGVRGAGPLHRGRLARRHRHLDARLPAGRDRRARAAGPLRARGRPEPGGRDQHAELARVAPQHDQEFGSRGSAHRDRGGGPAPRGRHLPADGPGNEPCGRHLRRLAVRHPAGPGAAAGGRGRGGDHDAGRGQPARAGELRHVHRADLPRDGHPDRASRHPDRGGDDPGHLPHGRQRDDGRGGDGDGVGAERSAPGGRGSDGQCRVAVDRDRHGRASAL